MLSPPGGDCQHFAKGFSIGWKHKSDGSGHDFVNRDALCGFAAAHGGKALPYRDGYKD